MRITIPTILLIGVGLFLAACDRLPWSEVGKAHKAVAEKMFDPDAAKFQNDEVSSDGKVVCGEVNGKNRMGAYVGFVPYRYYTFGMAQISDGPPDFEEYFRDTQPYNEYTSKKAIEKIFSACFFVEQSAAECPADKRTAFVPYLANCKLLRDGGDAGKAKIKNNLGID